MQKSGTESALGDIGLFCHSLKAQKTTKPTNMSNRIKTWLTLNIRQSSSRQLNLPACFHGMRKMVLSGFIHLSPGKLSLQNSKMCKHFCIKTMGQRCRNNDRRVDHVFYVSNQFLQFTFQSSSPATVSTFAGFSRPPLYFFSLLYFFLICL